MCALQIELMHLKQMPNINTFCEIKDCALLFMCLHAMCVQKKNKLSAVDKCWCRRLYTL